jgi:hypothetical protein
MRPLTLSRIAADAFRREQLSQVRLALKDLRGLAATLGDVHRRRFARYVIADFVRYTTRRVTPVAGETLGRAHAAAAWLARAHDATGREGLSYGYFPSKAAAGWRPAYAETTGYTVPTFIAYADLTGDQDYRVRAMEMAHWTLGCQMPSGGVPGGMLQMRPQVAVAFNTGMVLHGLIAAYQASAVPAFLDGARRAAAFLVNDIDANGYFRSHGPFVAPGVVKTYTVLCAWPLYVTGLELKDERLLEGACRVGDAALRQQNARGWFANNCLGIKLHAPLLHTIGYTLQGLLELGIVSGKSRYIEAVVPAVEGLLEHCRRGFLSSRWYGDWQPAAVTSCLTGSAQLAVVCFRLAAYTGDDRFREAAAAVLDYLKGVQAMKGPDAGIVGALGGSFPLAGPYMRFGFPQWATKFYLDALLYQEASRQRASARLVTDAVPLTPSPDASYR